MRLPWWLPATAALCLAPLLGHASDGGALLGAPVVRVSVTGGETPCAAPCRETSSRRNTSLTFQASLEGGEAAATLWELQSAPTGSLATLLTPTQPQTVLTPDAAGRFEIGVRVEDAAGNVGRAAATLTVQDVSFLPMLQIQVDGSPVRCEPECPANAVRIASDVVANALGTMNDVAHGPLKFEWNLRVPPGSTVSLTRDEPGKVTFKPDVDGTYQLMVKVADDQDSQELVAGFVIPNVFHWKPLQCACGGVPGWPPVGLGLVGVLALCTPQTRRAHRRR